MKPVHDPVVKCITAARVSLLFHHQFFGNLAVRFGLIEDDTQSTLISAPYLLRYNPAFIKKLDPRALVNRLKMEVLYNVLWALGDEGERSVLVKPPIVDNDERLSFMSAIIAAALLPDSGEIPACVKSFMETLRKA